MIGSIWVMFGD